MNTAELLAISLDALDDLKAQNVQAFDTTGLTNLFERVIICNGTSNRQTRALANHVREKVKEAGGEVLGIEGEETGEWVLVDMGEIVVHIMQPTIRDYYRLEELWGTTPIDASVKKPAAKKAAATKTLNKDADEALDSDSDLDDTTDAAPSAPFTAPAAVKKVPAKKAVTKTADAKTAATKTVAKAPVARKVAVKKTIV
jgi:ribosome-associated protein